MGQSHKEKRQRNKEICRMKGTPLNEIVFRFGLSEGAVRHIFRQAGIKLPDKNKKRNKEICKKVLAGESYYQVGREYGLTSERTRQIYLQSGRTVSPFKEKKRQKNFKRIWDIAEEYIKNRNIFPSKKELLEFLISRKASAHNTEIYRKLEIKYKHLPRIELIKREQKKEKLLNDLKHLYDIVKMPLSPSYHLRKFKLVSHTSYKKHFGTFRNACNLAGVPCGKRGGNAKEASRLIRQNVESFE